MSVDRDEVRRIADLAKLDLASQEADRLTGEMNRILEHAERLRRFGADEGGDASDDGASRDGVRGGAEGASSGVGGDSSGAGTGESEPTGAANATSAAAGGPSEPDVLLRPPDAFAPEMVEGFFAVPPPPGVVADEPVDDAGPDIADGPDGAHERGVADEPDGARPPDGRGPAEDGNG